MNLNIIILYMFIDLTVTAICYHNKTINLVLMSGIAKILSQIKSAQMLESDFPVVGTTEIQESVLSSKFIKL